MFEKQPKRPTVKLKPAQPSKAENINSNNKRHIHYRAFVEQLIHCLKGHLKNRDFGNKLNQPEKSSENVGRLFPGNYIGSVGSQIVVGWWLLNGG